MLEDLVNLSRDPSPETRRLLLRSVSDIFLDSNEAYSDRALILFSDVLGSLLTQVGPEARAEIAERIADAPQVGQALHVFLADGEIDIASPVLRRSELLDDASLSDLAARKSQAHLEAIAMRDHLSETVTTVLIERGDSPVLRAVTRNMGAAISAPSFEKLAVRAEKDGELLDAMSYRPDMPGEVANRVLKLLPEEARVRLGALLAADRDSVRPLIERAAALTRECKLDRALERLEAKGLVQQIRQGQMELSHVVFWLADRNRVLDLALVLAEFSDIDESVVTGALLKVNAAPVVILMRALDLGEDAVRSVANLRCRRLNLPNSMREHLLDRWAELDTATARRALRFTLASKSAQLPAA